MSHNRLILGARGSQHQYMLLGPGENQRLLSPYSYQPVSKALFNILFDENSEIPKHLAFASEPQPESRQAEQMTAYQRGVTRLFIRLSTKRDIV